MTFCYIAWKRRSICWWSMQANSERLGMVCEAKNGAELENASTILPLVQGPKATATLQKLIRDYLQYLTIHLNMELLLVLRMLLSPTQVIQVQVVSKSIFILMKREAIWNALFESGAEFGINPLG